MVLAPPPFPTMPNAFASHKADMKAHFSLPLEAGLFTRKALHPYRGKGAQASRHIKEVRPFLYDGCTPPLPQIRGHVQQPRHCLACGQCLQLKLHSAPAAITPHHLLRCSLVGLLLSTRPPPTAGVVHITPSIVLHMPKKEGT